MIIPHVSIFSSALGDPNVVECLADYASHLAILGPVMLSCNKEDPADIDASSVISFLENASKKNACLLSGLTINNDDIVTKLLDSGLRAAFFDLNTQELGILERVLRSFPRLRIGLTISIDSLEAEQMHTIITQFSDCAYHFLFRSHFDDN